MLSVRITPIISSIISTSSYIVNVSVTTCHTISDISPAFFNFFCIDSRCATSGIWKDEHTLYRFTGLPRTRIYTARIPGSQAPLGQHQRAISRACVILRVENKRLHKRVIFGSRRFRTKLQSSHNDNLGKSQARIAGAKALRTATMHFRFRSQSLWNRYSSCKPLELLP